MVRMTLNWSELIEIWSQLSICQSDGTLWLQEYAVSWEGFSLSLLACFSRMSLAGLRFVLRGCPVKLRELLFCVGCLRQTSGWKNPGHGTLECAEINHAVFLLQGSSGNQYRTCRFTQGPNPSTPVHSHLYFLCWWERNLSHLQPSTIPFLVTMFA